MKQSDVGDCSFIGCALLVFLDRENNNCVGVEFSVNDSTDKWTIERYSYNTTGGLRDNSAKVTSFTDIGITLGETKCSFYLDSYRESEKRYKAICVNKLDDLSEYMREQFVRLVPDLEFENATDILYVNEKIIEKLPYRYSVAPLIVCDTFISGTLRIEKTEEILEAGLYFIYSQKQKRIVIGDMTTGAPVVTKDVTLSKTYGKVIDLNILSNGNIKILTEGEQFGKTIDLILNYTEKTFDIQETEAISEETKNIQKMFVSDIGEIYAEQGESADALYIAGLTYDTSIKVHTVNGDKTIPTLDGMDELETRVQNIEKKVSSSENEMSLIETEINKVNKNIADVNANVESVGEQVAQWVLVGEIKAYLGATIPDKYLLCNGQEIAVADYPELYAVIGSLECCQSENVGLFKVPNLQDRFLQGANGNLGKRIEAGLPNITGSTGGVEYIGETAIGAFSAKNASCSFGNMQGSRITGSVTFSASKGETKTDGTLKTANEHHVYGASNTVQPPAVCVNYIIRAKI